MGGRVLAVTSGKGGCGKSTICVLLGDALAREGKRVLLLETDAGLRALDLLLGVPDRAVFDLADLLCGRCRLEQAAVPSAFNPRLLVIPAPYDHRFLPDPKAFAALVDRLRQGFDFLFIDTPAGLGSMLSAVAGACDCALLAVTPDPVCVRDAARVSSVLDGLIPMRLIINRIPARRRSLAVPDLDFVIDQTGVQLLGVVPEDPDIYACTCAGTALPADNRCGRRAFENIAGRLLGREVDLLLA